MRLHLMAALAAVSLAATPGLALAKVKIDLPKYNDDYSKLVRRELVGA